MTKKALLLLLLLPFICSDGLGQSRIFWADAQHPKIRSAHLDGSNVTTVSPATLMTGMTIDHERGWIYYLSYPLGHGVHGELRRMPMAGGGEELLLETGWTEGGLAIDYADDKIYWVTRRGDMSRITIMRANLDGSGEEEIAADVSEHCYGLAVDPVERHVYWMAREPGGRPLAYGPTTIFRINVDSRQIEEVGPRWDLPPYPRIFDGDISIDVQARKMYWTRRGNRSSSGMIGVFRSDLDGSNAELIFEDSYADAGDIVVDGVNHYVYWTQWSSFIYPAGVLIRRVRTDRPVTWRDVEDVVAPPDTPDDLTKGLALFLDPGSPILEAPAAQAQGVSTTTVLRWRRVECSPRYDVQVASDSAFSQIVFRENTPHQSSEFVAPVAQRRYWWRIHSNACGIASHWSAPRWFEVGSSGPLAPNLLTPEHNATTGPIVVFSWNPGPEAARHTFQLSTMNDFSSTVVSEDSLVDSDYEVVDLLAGQTYYWRVAGFDDAGRYTFSSTQSLSVLPPPGPVSLLEPADGQVEVPAYAMFSWSPAQGADAYHFELSNTTDFAATVVDTVLDGTGYMMTGPLAYAAEHYWRVCGVNISGEGPWNSRTFVVAIGTATEPSEGIPLVTELGPAYPNPAGRTVHFPVSVATPGRVHLVVYDLFGRRVVTLEDRNVGAGRFERELDVSGLAGGVYLAVLNAGNTSMRSSFVVLR